MPYNRRPDRLAAELVGVSGQQADLTGRRLQGLPPSPPSLSVGRTDRGPRPPPRREAAINPSNLYGRFQAHRGSTTSRTRASSTPPSTVFNTKRKVRSTSIAVPFPPSEGKRWAGVRPTRTRNGLTTPRNLPRRISGGQKKVQPLIVARFNAIVRIRH